MSSENSTPVRRRRVFYIPGYDPFPPRRYRELYRREAALQATVSGYDIAIKAGIEGDGFGWQVSSQIDGQHSQSEVEVLNWSDIVQDSRPDSVYLTYRDLVKTVWIYVSTGAVFRLMRLRKGPLLAAFYPLVSLFAQAVFAASLGWAMFRVATLMGQELGGTASIVTPSAAVLGAAVTALVLRWFRDHDGRFFAYYLMHDFAHSASRWGAYPPELEARLTVFKARIEEAMASDADEVLIVGHSSGAHLAVSVLSDVLRSRTTSHHDPALALLSLGQVVPMVSFLPKATRLRRDLQYLSQSQDLMWVDVTAPGDGCCFSLCDPVAVSGLATPKKFHPLVFSAAFTQSLSAERWRELRWRFFRLHFQYICAFDRPKDYDYFQITAGPKTLAVRYAARVPSRGRLETACTGYATIDP